MDFWSGEPAYRETNYEPWRDYRVLGKWLDDLWSDGKLSNETYDFLASKVRVGYSARKRDVEQVVAAERTRKVDLTLKEVEQDLAKLRAPFRTFPEVLAWEDSFLKLQFRWKLLVLVADSASGKSSFAESLFASPCVVTVEEAENLGGACKKAKEESRPCKGTGSSNIQRRAC